MLRGRRLLLPQSPLSGWTTTASTTTASARYASHLTTSALNGLESDESAPAQQAQAQIEEGEQVKEENEEGLQGRPSANSEATTKDPKGPHALALRKYAVDGTVPLDALYVYAKLPNRYQKLASLDKQPLDRQKGKDGRQFEKSVTSATKQVDYVQLPLVKGDAANEWNEAWVRRVGKRLGLRLSTRDVVYFKLSIARRLGLKVQDPRLASPAMALAAIEQRDRLARNISMAKDRQQELEMEGREPSFLRRNFDSKGDPNFKFNAARLRWDSLEAEGRAPISPAKKKALNSAQLSTGDLVGAGLRDSLRDTEATSARPSAGKAGEGFTKHTDSLLQRRGPAIEERFEPSPQMFRGERAPTGIRFTVRPTWLPFEHPTRQVKKISGEETITNHLTEETGDDPPIPKADRSEDQQQLKSATDVAVEPTSQVLGSSADDANSNLPESRLLPPEQADEALLSMTPKRKKTHYNIFEMLFPESTEPDPQPSQAQGGRNRKAKPAFKSRAKPEARQGSIYKKLFPDDVSEEMEPHSEPQSRPQPQEKEGPNEEDLVPPEESIFISLRNEVRNWIPEEQRKDITAPEPGEHGSHSTVLILSGLSSSLIDSDFYRILPEAKHIEGWAGGLVKVVQARDALSHEPVGQYFLMFHSHPAADAYKAEVLRLHSLSKRLLHSSMGTGPLAEAPTNPQPFLTEEEKAAVRSFTLCPPTAPLHINVHMWSTNLIREIARSTNIADVVQALRPDVSTPSKVLVTVNTIPGSKAGTGGGLTTDELWLTLRDDGRERGAPWVLSNLTEGIMPIKMTSNSRHGKIDIRSEAMQASLEGPIYDELDMLAEPPPSSSSSNANGEAFAARKVTYDAWHDRNAKKDDIFDKTLFLAPESTGPVGKVGREEKFNRFVLTFTQLAVARRFVRSWHKRAIWDAYEKRSVSIDAVALM